MEKTHNYIKSRKAIIGEYAVGSYTTILSTFGACVTYRRLADEFKTKKDILKKFKEWRKYKKIKDNIVGCINALYDDKWDQEYIYNLERNISTIIGISDYKDIMHIPCISEKDAAIRPMWFYNKNTNEQYEIHVIGFVIIVKIIYPDNTFRRLLSHIDSEEVTEILNECKKILISVLLSYIDKK